MKKVVIFGGSGFLGSYVADELSMRGYNVVIADLIASEHISSNQEFVNVDITDLDSVTSVLSDVEIVYNFAALADLEDANKKPLRTVELNILGNLNILEACKNSGSVERFVYASSAYALSSAGSFYGISKQSSEKLVEEYYYRYGLKYSIIRYGSLYGERAGKDNYIYRLLFDAIVNNELVCKGDGQDIREYIHASDAAMLSVDIIERKEYENNCIILTGIEKLKRTELLMMINEMMQNKLEVKNKSHQNDGHYKITPYTFLPSSSKKLVANPYIDLGQGLLKCMHAIHSKYKGDV
jgi:UDP-glucose 4-epimerase